MKKIPIDLNCFPYPMPMTLIGALVEGRPNFLAAAWISRVNYQPPLIAVALGESHYTNLGIEASDFFSVNVPSAELIKETDYCGLVSGNKVDKSGVFDVFYGVHNVPLITECAVSLECKVIHTIELEVDTLFIGQIVGAYSEQRYLTHGHPDMAKIKPFCLTMPDNRYWSLGKHLGKAWRNGEALAKIKGLASPSRRPTPVAKRNKKHAH
jgi:flavin reductase (DIM6/NTAB) family NADH-FMN oxidoreductase RutF